MTTAKGEVARQGFLPSFALAILAVVVGRLILAGPWGWWVLAFLVPVILAFLARRAGWPAALVVVAVFVLATVSAKAVLASPLGWVVFPMILVAGVTGGIAWGVIRARRDPGRAES